MTNLQNELATFNKDRNQVKEENTAKDDFPIVKRAYKYRKSTIVYVHDLTN